MVRDNYGFLPFDFIRRPPAEIAAAWDKVDVLAFSSSMWNHQLNLALAKRARQLFPQSLIVFGGPHVPTDSLQFLVDEPVVDVAINGEGETAFAELLQVFTRSRDFSTVNGVVFRHPVTGQPTKTPERTLVDLNLLPSPYLAGLYDEILNQDNGREHQVILETDRGCPFHCAFCAWGNAITKVRLFDLDRIKREVEWLSDHRISYVFGANANFGMLPRDLEIAEMFVAAKKARTYPKTFRVCYGKNAEDRVFNTARILEASELTKGVTVSFQSTDPTTLVNIGRKNISLTTYRNLLQRYRREKMSIYTELILGLAGETRESFTRGLEEVFQAGLRDQVGIFFCEVLPNTDMDRPEYRRQHGIETRLIELTEPHASPRASGEVTEYEEIVVATSAMPLADWRWSATLGWLAQTLHGLKLGFFPLVYLFEEFGIKYTDLLIFLVEQGRANPQTPIIARELVYYDRYLDDVLSGRAQCVFLSDFGQISWQIEETTFLRLAACLPAFYEELLALCRELLVVRGESFDPQILREVIEYQAARVAGLDGTREADYRFSFNLPEYFEAWLDDRKIPIKPESQGLTVDRAIYADKPSFARQVIWYGRRDSRAIEKASWCLAEG